MSSQTMTAARFGGITRNGIRFVEFEDGDTWCALDHVNKGAFAEAVNQWFRDTAGSLGEPECFEADAVEHLWAIETAQTLTADPCEWFLRWIDPATDTPVTDTTPGSFAISLIRV